jgi:hypothetical protein
MLPVYSRICSTDWRRTTSDLIITTLAESAAGCADFAPPPHPESKANDAVAMAPPNPKRGNDVTTFFMLLLF